MKNIEQVTVLGAGVIGASWTSLFLACGLKVNVYDPANNVAQSVADYVKSAWPMLEQLGMTENGDPRNIEFFNRPDEALVGSQFVQENVPEQLPLKHQLFAQIEGVLEPQAIVASSASGLMLSEMQQGWSNPSRFILGHPFNPPHLIPLVELLANDKTEDGVLQAAEAFYLRIGKVTIRVKREVPAHVANRLQAALWREAIHLVETGVASVEDVDKAVWAGPGLRWAAMGPHQLFHLGAGAGGLQEFCHRYRDSFHRWWEDLGDTQLTSELAEKLAAGVDEEARGEDIKTAAKQRDAMIVAMLAATKPIRNKRHQ